MISRRYSVYKSELLHLIVAAALIYGFLWGKSLSDGDVIGITALGAASFAVGARMLDSLLEKAIRQERVRASFERFLQRWLLPEPLATALSLIGWLGAKIVFGALLAALLYTLDGLRLAVFPTLVVGGMAFGLYTIANVLFWVRWWGSRLTQSSPLSQIAAR